LKNSIFGNIYTNEAMGKRNLLNGSVLVLLIMGMAACRPVVKKGEIIQVGGEELARYWDTENEWVSGDTVVLEQSGAALASKFEAENFSMTASLLTTGGAEGKLLFHAASSGKVASKGYAVMINNSDYRSGSSQKTGSLMFIRNNFVRTASDDKWFNLKVEVRANHIRIFVDDKIISEYIEPVDPLRIKGLEGMILGKGNFVLQKSNDAGKIAVGDIRIEAYESDIQPETDSVFLNDSTGEMLTLMNQRGFPVIDFHGHLKGGLTVEQVCQHGRTFGYNYGIAPNCGLNFPVTNDSALLAYYNEMAPEPVFKAMQCEGREWITLFTPPVISKYDYIFTDAMTWTDHKGRRMRLWMPEETFVDNEQQFMDMLVGKIEAELSQEPVDVYVNPTYLPEVLARDYDRLWTQERMERVIRVLVDNDVALEINSRFRIPSLEFVKRAKAAGVKFTIGTNNAGNNDLGRLEYSLKVIEEAGITADDMFLPRPAGEKKVLKKGLPSKITG
jgi:hypothetical protein